VDAGLESLELWIAESLTDATPTFERAHLGASSSLSDAMISEFAP